MNNPVNSTYIVQYVLANLTGTRQENATKEQCQELNKNSKVSLLIPLFFEMQGIILPPAALFIILLLHLCLTLVVQVNCIVDLPWALLGEVE